MNPSIANGVRTSTTSAPELQPTVHLKDKFVQYSILEFDSDLIMELYVILDVDIEDEGILAGR